MTERAWKGIGSADFTVGAWLVQPSLNRINRGGESLRLRPQLMNLLVCLADRAGQTVARDEILAVVWPAQYVADTGLARCIAELRQALGDTAGQDSRYIETIPKRGYRMIAAVTAVSAAAPALDVVPGSAGSGGVVDATAAREPMPQPPSTAHQPVVAAGEVVPRATGRSPLRRPTRGIVIAAVAAIGVVALAAAFLAWRSLADPRIAEHDTLVSRL